MKNKFCTLLACLLLLNTAAYAEGTPEKFKNPIFNDVLWAANVRANRHMKVSPQYWDLSYTVADDPNYLNLYHFAKCSYITEDNKAVFLKCNDLKYKNIIYYIFLFSRYQSYKNCNVWLCMFDINDGIINPSMENPSLFYSEIYNCQDELDDSDFPDNFKLNCMEELKARGWQKYIPGKLPDEK